jgi:hypothetical protein
MGYQPANGGRGPVKATEMGMGGYGNQKMGGGSFGGGYD